jgi:hypothetical protein
LEPLTPLPRLDKGACAVTVWSRSEPRGPILVIAGTPPVARIRRNGRLKLLPRSGEPAVEGRQVFRGMGLRLDLMLELRPGLVLQSPTPPEGVLGVTEADGVSTLIPVTALPSCG